MMDQRLLSLLRCPQTRSALERASSDDLHQVNQAIARGELVNRLGQRIERPLDEGLVNHDRSLLYPVYDGIAQMLADEAVPLDQLHRNPAADGTASAMQEPT